MRDKVKDEFVKNPLDVRFKGIHHWGDKVTKLHVVMMILVYFTSICIIRLIKILDIRSYSQKLMGKKIWSE